MNPIVRIVIILIASAAICQAVVPPIEKGLVIYNNHSTERLTELFVNKTKHDVLFIGSSRTHTNTNPRIIDSICKLDSYNAGIEGGNLLEFKMTLEAYLQNHPAPELLILSLDLHSFDFQRPLFNHTQYFPFLDNKVINDVLITSGHNTALQKYIPFLSIVEYDDYAKSNALKGITGRGGKQIAEGEFQYKGYLSNSYIGLSVPDTLEEKETIAVSDTAIQYLNEIIHICKEKKIQLVFTYSPEYRFYTQKQTINAPQIFSMITTIAQKNNLLYFRDDSLTMCNDPALFANISHLNTLGAEKYSVILGNRINTIYRREN